MSSSSSSAASKGNRLLCWFCLRNHFMPLASRMLPDIVTKIHSALAPLNAPEFFLQMAGITLRHQPEAHATVQCSVPHTEQSFSIHVTLHPAASSSIHIRRNASAAHQVERCITPKAADHCHSVAARLWAEMVCGRRMRPKNRGGQHICSIDLPYLLLCYNSSHEKVLWRTMEWNF